MTIERSLPNSSPPIPNSSGIEGHGESIPYYKQDFYYRVGKYIPKDKVVHLTYEGCYLGRQNGDKEYIIVAWDGQAFAILDHICTGERLKPRLKRFDGMTPLEAIALVEEEERKRQAVFDALPKCKVCLGHVLRFDDDQPADMCSTCFDKTKPPKVKTRPTS